MKNTLFANLTRKQRKTAFGTSDEMVFFLKNSGLLGLTGQFSHLAKADEPFEIIRANILLRCLFNKHTIEESYRAIAKALEENKNGAGYAKLLARKMKEAMGDLPFLKKGKEKIYVPFFSETINRIYAKDFEKLSLPPYDSLTSNYQSILIDPFDAYGDDLYDSSFTKLILVKKTEEGSAFFDYDSDAVYFVNKQGRLDAKLSLFDTGIKNPSHNQMLRRLTPVVESYYMGNKEEFESLLVENKLISSKLIYSIRTKQIGKISKSNPRL